METEIFNETLNAETPAQNSFNDGEAELERLREEIRTLNERIAEKQAQTDKISAELGAFAEYFPEVELKSIPDEVWDEVKSGNSLASSYALYTHKTKRAEQIMQEQNEKNAYFSAGRVGKNTANEYFTPDDVKKMSGSEVKANYSKIIASMKKWNR